MTDPMVNNIRAFKDSRDASDLFSALWSIAGEINRLIANVTDLQAENALLVQALEYSGRELQTVEKAHNERMAALQSRIQELEDAESTRASNDFLAESVALWGGAS